MPTNLDFTKENTHYATHGLHSYAAKCPPQLVKYGLQKYSKIGDLVLDPMVGSGTTLVEAKIHKRNSIGFDIDPLACLISRTKSKFISDKVIEKAYLAVMNKTNKDILLLQKKTKSLALIKRAASPEFPNIDYWFTKGVQEKLALLSFHINNTKMNNKVRDFLWVAFSGIILTKVSVANARDIIHSRHHFLKHQDEPDVLVKFERRILKMRKQMREFGQLCGDLKIQVNVRAGDSRSLPIKNNSIDFIFTSPPYATALDYPRAHFLAVSWMQSALGVDIKKYKQTGEVYIGSERGKTQEKIYDTKLGITAQSVIAQLNGIDNRKSRLVERYFHDMACVISEMNRVLKPNKYVVIVVCPSHIRKIEIPTHKVFTEIASSLGMKLVAQHLRTIDAGKRVLPYVRGGFGNRMSTEYVLIYKKGS